MCIIMCFIPIPTTLKDLKIYAVVIILAIGFCGIALIPSLIQSGSDTTVMDDVKDNFYDMKGYYENSMYGMRYAATITSDGRLVLDYSGMGEIYYLERNSKEPIAKLYLDGELRGTVEIVGGNVLLLDTNGSGNAITMYRRQ